MTWSYDASTIATVAKNYVRFLIGDTNSSDKQLDDEAIEQILTLTSNLPFPAAMQCCVALQAIYSRRADISIDSFRVSMSDRVKNYETLFNRLRIQNISRPGALGAPVVSGISISGMTSADMDSDRFPSRNSVGMMEAPGVLPPTSYYETWPFFLGGV